MYVVVYRHTPHKSWVALPKIHKNKDEAEAEAETVTRSVSGAETKVLWIDL